MPPSLELRTKQSLALTPRLQQSVRLLQLSSLEFQQELRNALDTNPFLEYDETQAEDNALSTDNGNSMGDTPMTSDQNAPVDVPMAAESNADVGDNSDSQSHEDSMNEFSSDPFGRTSTRNNGDGEGSDPADWVRIEPSLHETLHDTLRLYPINDRDRAVAQLIIEALDDDGYLRQDLQELSELVDIEPALSEDELNIALKLVQSLDKPGVGARTLSECLSLQLEALCRETPGREVALEIVAHHLERLARREQAELQKKIGCSAEELRIACALVRKLDPKPGANYGWPTVSQGRDYSGRYYPSHHELPGFEAPFVYWNPAIAVSGMTFYTGERFPKWKGNIFVGSLAFAHLERVPMNEKGEPRAREWMLVDLKQRIRDVRQGPEGAVYLLSGDGMILRLTPKK